MGIEPTHKRTGEAARALKLFGGMALLSVAFVAVAGFSISRVEDIIRMVERLGADALGAAPDAIDPSLVSETLNAANMLEFLLIFAMGGLLLVCVGITLYAYSARRADESSVMAGNVVKQLALARDSLGRASLELDAAVASGSSDGVDAGTGSVAKGADASFLAAEGGIERRLYALSLEAAVEAGRAGEHGRRFAVVAEDLRVLSLGAESRRDELGRQLAAVRGALETAGDELGKLV